MTDYLRPPPAQVIVEGDFAALVFERRLPHPPEVVWEANTEPAQLGF